MSHRAVPLLLALLVAAPGAALAPEPAAAATTAALEKAASACEGLRSVPGLGFACPERGGWRIPLADGSSVWTHGPDAAPETLATLASPMEATTTATPPVCVADPLLEPHGHVLYTRPTDKPSRHAALEADIRGLVHAANGILLQDSTERGAPMTYRMRCAEGAVEVTEVVLATPSASDDFSTIMNDLRAQGYLSPKAKYWIWHDDGIDCGCGGIGTLVLDERLSPTNGNNGGPSYGATFGYLGSGGVRVMMHENGHNLGAVQHSAPQSSGAGHCNDGLDIMCYGDGGPTAHYSSGACRDRQRFDCGHDTYFDPAPTRGEWLFGHWNLGSPYDRFLSGCFYATGRLVVGLAGVEAEGMSSATLEVPPACAGRPFAVYAAADALSDDYNVCWYADETLLSCKTQRWQDAGTVPDGTTRARVVYALGAGGEWTLSIV